MRCVQLLAATAKSLLGRLSKVKRCDVMQKDMWFVTLGVSFKFTGNTEVVWQSILFELWKFLKQARFVTNKQR